ncbi:hypothetical protein [Streptomyces poonensis]|nr:hypothetical protein [Streptomyces poonensis]
MYFYDRDDTQSPALEAEWSITPDQQHGKTLRLDEDVFHRCA